MDVADSLEKVYQKALHSDNIDFVMQLVSSADVSFLEERVERMICEKERVTFLLISRVLPQISIFTSDYSRGHRIPTNDE